MKNQDLYQVLEGLEGAKKKKVNDYVFNITVSRNIRLIKAHLEDLESIKADPASYTEFLEEARKLAKSHAKKNDKGQPMMMQVQGGSQYVFDDNAKFEEAYNKLMTSYQDAIDEREAGILAFNKALKAEVDINIFKLSAKLIEKYFANDGEVIENLFDIIEDDLEREIPPMKVVKDVKKKK